MTTSAPTLSALLGPDGEIGRLLDAHRDRLLGIRRHLHAHPELSRQEHATTGYVADVLTALGLAPEPLPGTGLVCDIPGAAPELPPIGFRADMDALAIPDTKSVPFRSTVDGVCHACGHDVHMTVLLGVAFVLADLTDRGLLRRGVRLVFQPAEEVHPCGARDVIEQGAVDDLDSLFTVHCDPSIDVGTIGLKAGPITSATDPVEIVFRGSGGHTSRPHLTQDLITAMGQVATEVPAALSRRLDPRSGINLSWGRIEAGSTFNAIPAHGVLQGTLRCLDHDAWDQAEEMLVDLVEHITGLYGVEARVGHSRGVPPVANDAGGVDLMKRAASAMYGAASIDRARQSLGGEDFAWYLGRVPGALARLGTRTPGGRTFDLHMGDLLIDERAIVIGAGFLSAVALLRDH